MRERSCSATPTTRSPLSTRRPAAATRRRRRRGRRPRPARDDVRFARRVGALPPGEPPADLALTAELLKVPGATVEPVSGWSPVPVRYRGRTCSPPRPTVAGGRVRGPGRRRRVSDRRVPVVYDPVRNAAAADAELDQDAEQTLQAAEHRRRDELRIVRDQLRAELQPRPAAQRDLRGAGRRAHHDARGRRPGHAAGRRRREPA